MDKDKVITDKASYDDLLEKAKELRKEKESKKIQVYVNKSTSRYSYFERTPTYAIDISIGEKIPDELINQLKDILRQNRESLADLEEKQHKNFKVLQDTTALMKQYENKIDEIPQWKKWLLNIK